MRIAMVSTASVPVPPLRYGGTELVVSELVRGLSTLGHEVVLFAPGDSRPPCALSSFFPESIWPPDPLSELAQAAYAADCIRQASRPFDLVHAHVPSILPLARFMGDVPVVYTLHHEQDPASSRFYGKAPEGIHWVAVSRRQATFHQELSPLHVVHHGLDPDLYPFGRRGEGYLAFLGRLSPVKGPDVAIEVAGAVGMELRMGGPMQPSFDGPEWSAQMEKMLDVPFVRRLGDLDHAQKTRLLAGAEALLFPIGWEEPFGLVMIEAMLCGCPVVAFARGAVAEVVEHGVTGFVARDPDDMARLVREELPGLNRRKVRARALERFSSLHMVEGYLRVYEQARRSARVVSLQAAGVLHG